VTAPPARRLRAVVIEDSTTELDWVEKQFKSSGLEVEWGEATPRFPDWTAGLKPMADAEIGTFDVALVDLVLHRAIIDPATLERRDIQGGDAVLPWLRANAPWLPAIAVSNYLGDKQTPKIAPYAWSFGFDGALPKYLVDSSHDFTPELWAVVLDAARRLRRQAWAGAPIDDWRTPELEASNDDREFSERELPRADELLREAFGFAKRLVISPMTSGRSGARMFRVEAESGDGPDSTSSEWAVKLSTDPCKLHREATAHRGLLLEGIPFARSVPMLGTGVWAKGGIGLLAYQMVPKSRTAAAALLAAADDDARREVAAQVAQVVGELRGAGSHTSQPRADDVLDLCGGQSRLAAAAKPCANAETLLQDLSQRGWSRFAPQPFRPTMCLVHGDLHWENILLSERVGVAIDFARRRKGPLAFDAAKLFTDAVLREMRDSAGSPGDHLPLDPSHFGWWGRLGEAFDLTADDEVVFRVCALLLYLAASSYRDAGGIADTLRGRIGATLAQDRWWRPST
jgi:hypothetical protein